MWLLAGSQGGLTSLDLSVIVVYLLLTLGMGVWIARRQRSTEDYFLGGRNLPAWAVGLSLIASLLSTITYLGMPGEMFRSGVAFLTRQLGLPLVLLVVWFLWIPFFMRLKLTSAYEYLERRYNYSVRALAAVFCLLLLFGWISVVVLTASMAMAEISRLDLAGLFGDSASAESTAAESAAPMVRDVDMYAIIVGMGLVTVLYTTLGGITADVWTDVIQFFVLLGGAFVTMAVIAWTTDSGLMDWLATSRQYRHEEVAWFSWDIRDRSTVFAISIGMFFWHTCTHGANQVTLQRYFSLRDIAAARRSFLVNVLSSIGLGVILAAVGIALMHFIQHHDVVGIPAVAGLDSADTSTRNASQDRIFPQFIHSSYFPTGLRGLVVAALFAAAMSTIDSGANSISAIVTIDFFRRLSGQRAGGRAELRLARILTASIGVVVIACSIGLYHVSKGTNLIDLCQKGFNCFLGPLGALFFMALFSPWSSSRSILPAIVVGEIVGVGASYSPELFGIDFSTHLVVPSAWLATVLADLSFSLILPGPSDEQKRWMWRSVVRVAGRAGSTGG